MKIGDTAVFIANLLHFKIGDRVKIKSIYLTDRACYIVDGSQIGFWDTEIIPEKLYDSKLYKALK